MPHAPSTSKEARMAYPDKIKYSREFKTAVQSLRRCDNKAEMLRLLKEGSPYLGRHLSTLAQNTIEPARILELLDSDDTETLREEAQLIADYQAAYSMWSKIIDAHTGNCKA